MSLFNEQDEDQIPDNAYEALVGADKKFKDNELLARGKIESDNFIKKLQAENSMLKTEVASAKKLEEFFNKVNQNQANTAVNNPPESQQNDNPDISAIVNAEIEKRLGAQRLAENINIVTNTLTERYGEAVTAEVAKKAVELGVTKAYLQELASKSPKVFLSLFPEGPARNTKDVFSAGPRTQVSSSPQFTNARNQAYYDDLRKKDRKTWDSMTTQRMADALALGEDFFTKN